MTFKFSFGLNPECAGTALTIPLSVWDSWQPFLAAPNLAEESDGTYRLTIPGAPGIAPKVPAWIYVFDFDAESERTPGPMRFVRTIGLTADALGYYAMQESPRLASVHLMSESGIYSTLRRRLQHYWPDHRL